jgi:hypothetical protein
MLVAGAAFIRVAVVPAEVCPPVTAAEVASSIDRAAGWLIGGQDATGRYPYGYDRTSATVNPGYNSARHAGVTMSLYQVYEATGDPVALAAADRGLGLTLDQLFETDSWTAWKPGGNIPVGANGLLLAALAIRRQATADPQHDDVMRGIGSFLAGQQQPDGSIYAYWDVLDEEPSPVYGPFATGEAAWALALLERAFPGEGWGETAARTVDYMATDRNETEGYLASLPDHWAAYTLGDLPSELLDEDRLDYARRLAGFFGIRLRFEAQRRGTGLNLLVRWYPGPPAGVGTAGEGIGALHRLSVRDPRLADLTPAIEARLVCTAGFMVERQVAPAESENPLESGAWFYRGYTQMDDQQHVVSALLAALSVLERAEEAG